ncbi:MAG: c-type cytochrome [Gallionella sp.]|nr:c-type cytochrome [Gallionella sp.]
MIKKLAVLFVLSLISGCGEKQPPKTVPNVGTFEEILAKASCMACHQAGSLMKFPSWEEVAEKYKDNKDAEIFLTNKIASGGSGSWGKMDMPPYPELSEAERRVVARGILATAPKGR